MPAESSAATQPENRTLVISRIFDAPRELVFKAWTEPERAMQWWGPRGFTVTSYKMDVRPGGSYYVCSRSPEGTNHRLQGVYREIVEPERFVSTYVWADQDGNPTRPETILTVTLEDLGGKTRLNLHQAVFESVTARDLHQGGWTSSLDCLAEYLERV